jgi:hypothetical protein
MRKNGKHGLKKGFKRGNFYVSYVKTPILYVKTPQNVHFPIKNTHFTYKNTHFISKMPILYVKTPIFYVKTLKNIHFPIKNTHFISKTHSTRPKDVPGSQKVSIGGQPAGALFGADLGLFLHIKWGVFDIKWVFFCVFFDRK